MAVLLFALRNVPDDEADDVRHLLSEHDIDFYETHAGRWGISMPGIWLRDETNLEQARLLLHAYQRERYKTAREAYESLAAEGERQTLLSRMLMHPLRFVMLIAALAFILYLTLMPFFSFGG